MEAWQERVIDERTELYNRMEKLATFLESDRMSRLSPVDELLLQQQYGAMCTYLGVLTKRIERF